MSTATAFKYYRPFPFCPEEISLTGEFDYVDVSLATAMSLYWNLEDLSFSTTGTRGPASINWTTTLGATESLPFTPSAINSKLGAYYDGSGTPADAPRDRVCETDNNALSCEFAESFIDGLGRTVDSQVLVQFFIYKTPGLDTIRILYKIFIFKQVFDGVNADAVIVANPNSVSAYGPGYASSGMITILGISLNWVGGGVDNITSTWGSETATLSATSSAFTY